MPGEGAGTAVLLGRLGRGPGAMVAGRSDPSAARGPSGAGVELGQAPARRRGAAVGQHGSDAGAGGSRCRARRTTRGWRPPWTKPNSSATSTTSRGPPPGGARATWSRWRSCSTTARSIGAVGNGTTSSGSVTRNRLRSGATPVRLLVWRIVPMQLDWLRGARTGPCGSGM